MLRSWLCTFASLGLVLAAAPAGALSLGFDEFIHGQIVRSSQGVIITIENFHPNPNHPDLGVAFDTTVTGSEDEDLEQGAGWSGGNLAPDTNLEEILIIQENDDCGAILCSNPDDEGRRPAGRITLDYTDLGTFRAFAFDLVDVDSVARENGSLEFFLDGIAGTKFDFSDFLALGQSVVFGDNTANRIDLGDVGLFDKVEITLGGSGGVDNITAVPEPSTLALFVLGLSGLAVVGRRNPHR